MTHPLDRRGGAPLRVGDGLPEFVRRLQARVDAGELGMSLEEEAEYARQQATDAAAQLAHQHRIQEAFLSRRHVRAARLLADGKLKPVSAIMQRLAQALEDDPLASVLLSGDTGAGKTTAATAYAVGRIREGWSCRHRQASRFAEVATNVTLRQELERVDLLILDELHRKLPDWIMTSLIGVIDERHQAERQTIGILTADDATAILGQEVVERFEVRLSTSEKSWRGK